MIPGTFSRPSPPPSFHPTPPSTGPNHNTYQSTTLEIYRPLPWNQAYVTWNNRNYNTPWTKKGGDWYDRTNAAQGNAPYASITFDASALPDNSSKWSNASQRPKLVINTSGASFAIEDVNQDGRINQTDLNIIQNSINTNTPCQRCDVNTDGIVDIYDVMRVSVKV